MKKPSNVDSQNCGKCVVNELLCFLLNKRRYVPNDNIVRLCSNFYTEDAVEKAKDLLYSAWDDPDHRKKPRKGPKKTPNNITDMLDHLQLMDEKSIAIPTYVALDLSNLPPISFDDIDVCSLLSKMEKMRTEFDLVKTAVTEQAAHMKEVEELCIKNNVAAKQVLAKTDEAKTSPPEDIALSTSTTPAFPNKQSEISKADGDCQKTLPWTEVVGRKKEKKPELNKFVGKRNVPTIGKAQIEGIKAISRIRKASIFVSRLDPALDPKVLEAHVERSVGFTVTAEKLKTRYNTYSSYHITALCDDPKKLLSADLWPVNALVRWFYNKRSENTEQA